MPFGTTNDSPYYNPNNGCIIPHPPEDTVSRLRFSPENSPQTFLMASSWNGSVRLWRIESQNGPAVAITEAKEESPILEAAWSSDGHAVYYSSLDNLVKRWDLGSNEKNVVARHDGPIRQIVENPNLGYMATVSWDRSLRYWDVREPTGSPMATVPLKERAYAMDSLGVLMVVASAGRHITVFDVRRPETPFQEKYSQLKHQSRCVACWPDSMGYVVGGVDGTVSVDHVQEPRQDANGVFTCHRDKGGPFSINAIRFNRATGAFATAASDGHVFIWDKNRLDRARVKRFERMRAPVCDVDFYHDGSMYAYAMGYDWSRASEGNNLGPEKNYIILQPIESGEMTLSQTNSNSHRGRGRGRRRGNSRRPG